MAILASLRKVPGQRCPFSRSTLRAEHEIHRTHHAQSCPYVISFDRLSQIKHRKRHKHDEGDCFLQNLKLRNRQCAMPYSIGRHLKTIFKKRDTPADHNSDEDGSTGERFEMAVPRKRHEEIGNNQKTDGECKITGHGLLELCLHVFITRDAKDFHAQRDEKNFSLNARQTMLSTCFVI